MCNYGNGHNMVNVCVYITCVCVQDVYEKVRANKPVCECVTPVTSSSFCCFLYARSWAAISNSYWIKSCFLQTDLNTQTKNTPLILKTIFHIDIFFHPNKPLKSIHTINAPFLYFTKVRISDITLPLPLMKLSYHQQQAWFICSAQR